MKEALLSSNNSLQEGEQVFIKNAFRTDKLSLQLLRLQCTVHFVRSPLDLARVYKREYEQCKDITPSLRVDKCDSLMVHLHASLVIALLNNKHPSQCFALARLQTSDFEPDRVIYQKAIAALEAS